MITDVLRCTAAAALLLVTAGGCAPLADGDLEIDVHITSIEPAQAPSTGGAQVTIVGRNFDDGIVVTFGGVPALAVERVSPGVLAVVPPPHAVGAVDVVVRDPDGREATRASAVHYFAGTPAVATGTVFLPDVSAGPPIFGGDIDGDGIPDALAYQHDPPAYTAVLLDADGHPRRGPAIPPAEGAGAPLALADVDGDGLADAVMAAGIVRSRGTSGWAPLLVFPSGWASGASAAAVADFDGDGTQDVALMTAAGAVVIHVAGGQIVLGTERLGAAYAPRLLGDLSPEQPVAGDFNGDGRADLAWVGLDGTLRVAAGPELAVVTLLPDNPRFSEQRGATFGALAAVDLDWDGRRDLVVADAAGTRVYLGGATALATTPVALPELCAHQESIAGISVAALDVPLGATVAARCDDLTRLFEAGPTETGLAFTPLAALRSAPRSPVTLADLDGDGKIDVIETTALQSLARYSLFDDLASYGATRLPVSPSGTSGGFGLFVTAGHFGAGTLVAANSSRATLLGSPLATGAVIATADITPDSTAFVQLVPCDLDGDGNDDVVALARRENTFELRTIGVRDRSLTISEPLATTTALNTRLVVGRGFAGCEAMLLEDDDAGQLVRAIPTFALGVGTATQRIVMAPQAVNAASVQLFDIDGDGDLDLYSPQGMTTDADASTPMLWRRAGDTLTVERPATRGTQLVGQHLLRGAEWAVAPHGDGTFTLWAYGEASNRSGFALLGTLAADGSVTVVGRTTLPALGDTDGATLVLGDFDGDGAADAIFAPETDATGGQLQVLTHPGGGAGQLFTVDVANRSGASPVGWTGLAVTDLDGDGLADVVFATGDYQVRLGAIRNASH